MNGVNVLSVKQFTIEELEARRDELQKEFNEIQQRASKVSLELGNILIFLEIKQKELIHDSQDTDIF